MLSGGWALQPIHSGEVFEDTDPIHIVSRNRFSFSAITVACLLFTVLVIVM